MEVTFSFDAKLLGGKTVVVFESLYREDVLLATHADLDDEGQTVRFQPAIGIITIKDEPSFIESIKTGDVGIRAAVIAFLCAAAALLVIVLRKRRRQN